MGFLDNTGLARFLNDIKSKFTAPKSIAYVESTTAKTNHAAGDHFMIGEQLKRATSAIATGETIGTSNSADDTVQGQIDTLKNSVDGCATTDGDARIFKMGADTQLFGIRMKGSNNHTVALICQNDGISLYDWNKEGGAGLVWRATFPTM